MNEPDAEREGFAAFMLRMRARSIVAKELFAAIEATPRHGFVPVEWQAAAWSNRMVPIECGEAIEGCDLQAAMIHALQLDGSQRVLEIGTGSGYTAAVMARLSARVLTLERFRTLAKEAERRFSTLGLDNVVVRQADGAAGAAADGPFDRIIVWAAFPEPPRSFAEQLTSGGIMVAPIGPADDMQVMARLEKTGSRFERTDLEHVRLQPLAEGIAAAI